MPGLKVEGRGEENNPSVSGHRSRSSKIRCGEPRQKRRGRVELHPGRGHTSIQRPRHVRRRWTLHASLAAPVLYSESVARCNGSNTGTCILGAGGV